MPFNVISHGLLNLLDTGPHLHPLTTEFLLHVVIRCDPQHQNQTKENEQSNFSRCLLFQITKRLSLMHRLTYSNIQKMISTRIICINQARLEIIFLFLFNGSDLSVIIAARRLVSFFIDSNLGKETSTDLLHHSMIFLLYPTKREIRVHRFATKIISYTIYVYNQ